MNVNYNYCKDNNNNNMQNSNGSSSVCFHFQNGRCRHKDNRECERKHIICIRGNNCNRPESYCKFLHPYNAGFEKTCKKTFAHCKFGNDCIFDQHPDQDFIEKQQQQPPYQYHSNNKTKKYDNNNGNTIFHHRQVNKKNNDDNDLNQFEQRLDEKMNDFFNHMDEKIEDIYSYLNEQIQSIHDHIETLFSDQKKKIKEKDHNKDIDDNDHADIYENKLNENNAISKKEEVLKDEN